MSRFLHTKHCCPLVRSPLSLFLLVIWASGGATARAQAQQIVPDAGQSIRSIERQPLALPPRQQLDISLPDEGEAPISASDGSRIAVKAFHISGNSKIDGATLAALLTDLSERELSLPQLREGARRITRLYRERGYPLARAWLPNQEIVDGVVRIDVIEGRYGEVRVDNQAHLNALTLAPLKKLEPGEVVQTDSLERTLLLMRELSGVNVNSTLQPGASVGTTDLLVETTPGPRLQGSVEMDNYGNHYTGKFRLGATLGLGNLLGLGDQLSLRLLGKDEEQRYGRIGWQSGGLGLWGTQAGLSYSYMHYALGKDFDVLEASGLARVASLWVAQPLVRSRTFSLSGTIQFDDKRLQDDIGLYSSRYSKHSRVVQTSVSGNGNDDWLGESVSSFLLAWSSGQVQMADSDYSNTLARTRGVFHKINANLARLQRLSGAFSLYGAIDIQWANRNLDSSEKMVLGGAYGVRAYPQGEASGDQGWLTKLELRYAVTPNWQLATVVDHGKVRINSDPWTSGRNHRSLTGAGLGAYWTRDAWYAQAIAAWKLGAEDATSGPDRTPRLWAQLGRRF